MQIGILLAALLWLAGVGIIVGKLFHAAAAVSWVLALALMAPAIMLAGLILLALWLRPKA